jgi:hypothetical protein
MAFSKSTLTLMKWLYWIFTVAIHLYLCYILFVSDRAIAGVLWLVTGFLLIYIMYYVYFPKGDPGSTWPPYIRPCPDYLTQVTPTACMDFVGLYSPKLKKANPDNLPEPKNPDYYQYAFNPSGTMAAKTARANQYGLTWEGVTD